MALDMLIRGATIVDGSGAPRFRGDVGVRGGRIVQVARDARIGEAAGEVIDAEGLVLAPGFIDGHTHMDAQVSWDPLGSCSCWHGVTTVVMGNCGFALAPCPPGEREWFARCLEAVEDIPVESMMTGIDWTWETFPQYLDHVERLPKGVNYGSYIGHSALRMYAMGRRGLEAPATEDDLRRMEAILAEALDAGALGFSTSRSPTHVTPDGTPVASRIAEWEEIRRLAGVMGARGQGILQIGPDVSGGEAQRAFFEALRPIALESGRPVMFGVLSTRQGLDPNPWEYQLEYIDEVNGQGGRLLGQATTRSINALFSFRSYLPFDGLPEWQALRALPLEEQAVRLRDPGIRRRLVEAEQRMKPRDHVFQGGGAATTDPRRPDYENLFALVGVDWDDPSIAELARRSGKHPVEVIIDLGLESSFDQVFLQPLVNESPEAVLGMLRHPGTLATFSDSGAHVCQEMGASLQTHLLSYWVRGREAFTLEEGVRMLTSDNARAWGLSDRGLVREGMAADLVLFDEQRVRPLLPSVETDLPGGARRLVQRAEGIEATIVNGVMTLRGGEATGRHPGVLIRG